MELRAAQAREALIAFRMEAELSKARILELYLNVIELGDGIFGIQAASTRYFGRPVARLSRRQAAMLAATIPSPRTDNPATETREFRWRTGLIYRRAFGRKPEPDTASAATDSIGRSPETVRALPAADSVNFSGVPLDTVPSTGGS
ncbi:MAG: biosynthetic peptidoglycan transglycosylase [Candidatus Palauibacterales bacterium]|nr:biosynthetic peptidoglycan transglycosylase [Candidatus Palauibacterales bacterium]